MITIQDLKIYMLNSGVLAVSFTEVEMLLKVVLLTATIIYTIQKIYTNEKK
jgi:hypothetical protein